MSNPRLHIPLIRAYVYTIEKRNVQLGLGLTIRLVKSETGKSNTQSFSFVVREEKHMSNPRLVKAICKVGLYFFFSFVHHHHSWEGNNFYRGMIWCPPYISISRKCAGATSQSCFPYIHPSEKSHNILCYRISQSRISFKVFVMCYKLQ